jgi:hypothetical protein
VCVGVDVGIGATSVPEGRAPPELLRLSAAPAAVVLGADTFGVTGDTGIGGYADSPEWLVMCSGECDGESLPPLTPPLPNRCELEADVTSGGGEGVGAGDGATDEGCDGPLGMGDSAVEGWRRGVGPES